MFILGLGAFTYGIYEVIYEVWCYLTSEPESKGWLLLIISVLKDFLLAFALIILSAGIYEKVRDISTGESKELDLDDIEKNFIGIVVLSMLVVVLGMLLPQEENIQRILYVSISIAVLIVAASLYIKCAMKPSISGQSQDRSEERANIREKEK